MKQIEIAKRTGLSEAFISLLLSGGRRPTWKTAKLLEAVTGVNAVVWLEAPPNQIRAALEGVGPLSERGNG